MYLYSSLSAQICALTVVRRYVRTYVCEIPTRQLRSKMPQELEAEMLANARHNIAPLFTAEILLLILPPPPRRRRRRRSRSGPARSCRHFWGRKLQLPQGH